MTGVRGIIANVGWLIADRIFRLAVGLGVGVWVARYLGVEQFGLLSYALAFVGLFSAFASLGLEMVTVKAIVHNTDENDRILGTVFGLRCLGGLVQLCLALSVIFLLRHEDGLTFCLVAILSSVGVFQAFDVIDSWFQSRVQSRFVVLARGVAFLVCALAQVALIRMHAPLVAFAWVSLMEAVLGAVGLWTAYRTQGGKIFSWRWDGALAQSLLKESWPLALAGFTILIYMKIDQIMLGQMAGVHAVGIYAAAVRVSEVWYFIPLAVMASVSPSIFKAKEKSEALYYERLGQVLRSFVLLFFVIAVPVAFFSGTIIKVLFGNGYMEAAPILSIHIWASLFVFLGVAISPWFIAEGLTRFSLRRALFGAVTNVILNLFLIPVYGGAGAAVATVISQAVAGLFSNATHPKTRKIFALQIKSLFLFTK